MAVLPYSAVEDILAEAAADVLARGCVAVLGGATGLTDECGHPIMQTACTEAEEP